MHERERRTHVVEAAWMRAAEGAHRLADDAPVIMAGRAEDRVHAPVDVAGLEELERGELPREDRVDKVRSVRSDRETGLREQPYLLGEGQLLGADELEPHRLKGAEEFALVANAARATAAADVQKALGGLVAGTQRRPEPLEQEVARLVDRRQRRRPDERLDLYVPSGEQHHLLVTDAEQLERRPLEGLQLGRYQQPVVPH